VAAEAGAHLANRRRRKESRRSLVRNRPSRCRRELRSPAAAKTQMGLPKARAAQAVEAPAQPVEAQAAEARGKRWAPKIGAQGPATRSLAGSRAALDGRLRLPARPKWVLLPAVLLAAPFWSPSVPRWVLPRSVRPQGLAGPARSGLARSGLARPVPVRTGPGQSVAPQSVAPQSVALLPPALVLPAAFVVAIRERKVSCRAGRRFRPRKGARGVLFWEHRPRTRGRRARVWPREPAPRARLVPRETVAVSGVAARAPRRSWPIDRSVAGRPSERPRPEFLRACG